MVPQDTMNSNNSARLLDTSELNLQQLLNYLALNEEINSYSKDNKNKSVLQLSAQLMREELFECTELDDQVLDSLEHEQLLHVKPELPSRMGHIMQYFDEDVNLPSSTCSTPTWQPNPIKISGESKSQRYPSVKDLKSKYEPMDKNKCDAEKKPKKPYGVKQMAQMFNNKVSQFMSTEATKSKRYAQLENEFSPEPNKELLSKPIAEQTPTKFPLTQNQPNATLIEEQPIIKNAEKRFPSERDFCQLTVKEKALLYQKLIESNQRDKSTTENSLKKKQTVKSLNENFESLINSSKEEFLHRNNKDQTEKSEQTEEFHTPGSVTSNLWPDENASKTEAADENNCAEFKDKQETEIGRPSIPLNARMRSTIYENGSSPLFVKLYTPMRSRQTRSASSDSACDLNSCATPFSESPALYNYDPKMPPPKPKRLRLTDAEFRPSSISTNGFDTRQSSMGVFNTKITETKLPEQWNQSTNVQVSIFWIIAGDMTVSLPIYYNAPDKLRLLYDIFSQKSDGSQDWHFGIDDHEFTRTNATGERKISSITKKKDASQYWFSSGDLAVPFTGKYMQPQKISCIFKFLRDYLSMHNETVLRFGIDDLEFSNITQNRLNLSMDSNYSMLLRLQSTNGNPNFYNQTIFEQAEANRLSLTPIDRKSVNESPFRFSFATESLDKLFGTQNKKVPKSQTEDQANNKHIEQLWARLQRQEFKLKSIKNDIRKLSGLHEHEHSEIIQQCKTIPEYVKQLTRMMRILLKLQKAIGFDGNNMDQLDACRDILNRYTDVGVPT